MKWCWFQDGKKSVTLVLLSGMSHTNYSKQNKNEAVFQKSDKSIFGTRTQRANKLFRTRWIFMKEQRAPLLCGWLHEVPSSDSRGLELDPSTWIWLKKTITIQTSKKIASDLFQGVKSCAVAEVGGESVQETICRLQQPLTWEVNARKWEELKWNV